MDEIEEGKKESDLKECIKENNNEDEKEQQEKAHEDIITEQNEVVSLDEAVLATPVLETNAKLEPSSLGPTNFPDFNELKKGRVS